MMNGYLAPGWRVLLAWLIGIGVGMVSASCQASDASVMLIGRWGGDRLNVVFDHKGARLEYDCAAGAMDGPVRLDAQGRFSVQGSHEAYRVGPDLADQPSARRTAHYEGRVLGTIIELQVRVDGDATVHRYRLEKNAKVKLVRCL